MNFPPLSLKSEYLTSRLSALKTRTKRLWASFEQIMSRADSVEADLDARSEKNDHERGLMAVMELFMRDDVRACTVTDYVIVFFRLLLAKLRQRGHDFDDVKQLHNALNADENVAEAFRTTLSRLAFPVPEQRAVRVLLEAMLSRSWPTSEVMTTSPGGDAQISSALVYLRCQPNIDPTLGAALQRALCAAHECVLTDMALTAEAIRDININASDLRKDDAYACSSTSVKYEDYADFADSAAAVECSSGDGLGARGRCLPLDSEVFHVPEPGAASKLARDILLKHKGSRSASSSSLMYRGASGSSGGGGGATGMAGDDGKIGGERGGGSGGGGGASGLRRRSTSFTGTDTQRAELQEACEAFAESCVVSSEMAVVDSLLQGRSATRCKVSCEPTPTAVTQATTSLPTDVTDESAGSGVEDLDSSPRREIRYAPNSGLYVICYDAGTSTSPEVQSGGEDGTEEADSPREPRHVTRPANPTPERKMMSSVATGTDDKD